jgi:hypothetical protein
MISEPAVSRDSEAAVSRWKTGKIRYKNQTNEYFNMCGNTTADFFHENFLIKPHCVCQLAG